MGGMGSGAPRRRGRIEETPSLGLDEITRGLAAGEQRSGCWDYVRYQVEPGDETDMSLYLEWSTRGGEHEQWIALVQRRTPTGGVYWVGWCPIGGYAVRRLYLSPNGGTWAGRCSLRLKHASTAESKLNRANRRVTKLQARIQDRGCGVEKGEIVSRPPHRRRDWIERMQHELGAAHTRADDQWLLEVLRVLPGLVPELSIARARP